MPWNRPQVRAQVPGGSGIVTVRGLIAGSGKSFMEASNSTVSRPSEVQRLMCVARVS